MTGGRILREMRRRVQSVARALGLEVSRSPASGRLQIRRRLDLGGDPFFAMRTILGGAASCLLDVGGHVGETALRFADVFPRATIFSLEPDPDNFGVLSRNVARCRAVVPIPKAAAARAGSAILHRTRFSQAHSLLKPRTDAAEYLGQRDLLDPREPVTVETVTLDAFCAERSLGRVDVLKVDAQGADLDVLRGAEGLLRERRVTLVFVEVNFVAFYEGTPLFPAVYEFLYERGFRLVGLYDSGFSTHYYQVGCNALFVEEQAGRRRGPRP